MKILLVSLAAILLFATAGCLTHGQNARTNNVPPLPPTGTVSTNATATLLAEQLAEMRTQIAELAKLLAEQRQVNAALAAVLTNPPAPYAEPPPKTAQTASQPPQKGLYYWDGNRYVLVGAGGTRPSPRVRDPRFPNAPGKIVGVRYAPQVIEQEYIADVAPNGHTSYRLMAVP